MWSDRNQNGGHGVIGSRYAHSTFQNLTSSVEMVDKKLAYGFRMLFSEMQRHWQGLKNDDDDDDEAGGLQKPFSITKFILLRSVSTEDMYCLSHTRLSKVQGSSLPYSWT